MRSIDVQITKAKIESFGVSFNEEGLPDVTATIALLTADSKKISTFQVATYSWQTNNFKLPPEMIMPIAAIAHDLEEIVIAKCNAQLGRLEKPKEEVIVGNSKVEDAFAKPNHIDDLRQEEKNIHEEIVETPLGEEIDGGLMEQ